VIGLVVTKDYISVFVLKEKVYNTLNKYFFLLDLIFEILVLSKVRGREQNIKSLLAICSLCTLKELVKIALKEFFDLRYIDQLRNLWRDESFFNKT